MSPIDQRLLKNAKSTRRYLTISVAIGVVTVGLIVWQAIVLADIVSSVFLVGVSVGALLVPLASLGVLVVGRALLAGWSRSVAQSSSIQVKSELRHKTVHAIAQVRALPNPAEVSTLLTTGFDAFDSYFGRFLPQVVLSAIAPIILLAAIFYLDWISGLIILATLPLVPIFMILVGKGTAKVARNRLRKLTELSDHLLDILSGLETLKLFGRAQRQVRVVGDIADDFRRVTMQVLRVAFLNAFVLELVATISTALVAVSIGLRLVRGDMTLAPALAALIMTPEVYLPLRRLGIEFHAAEDARAVSDRVFAILDRCPTEASLKPSTSGAGTSRPDVAPSLRAERSNLVRDSRPENAGYGLGCFAPLRFGAGSARERAPRNDEKGGFDRPQKVQLESVSYQYPNRQTPAVDSFSLTLNMGDHLVITGPNGCGKTTIARMLAGLISPDSGQLVVNGNVVGHGDLIHWRRHVTYVPQRPTLFSGSIVDNVRLGCPDASLDQVNQALLDANCNFVFDLEAGPLTQVGEVGRHFSAGESQRLAIARAFCDNRPLAIFDEPTSHLDSDSESMIRDSLARLGSSRTLVVIAHREQLIGASSNVLEMSRP